MKYNITAKHIETLQATEIMADSLSEAKELFEKQWQDGDVLVSESELVIKNEDDEINISWHIDDVKSLDESLTDDQCRRVLQLAKNGHDAEVGINWDTLRFWIEEVKGDEEDEE